MIPSERKFNAGLIAELIAPIESSVQRAQRDAENFSDGADVAPLYLFQEETSLSARAADLRARADQAFKVAAAFSSAAASYETLADVVHGSVGLQPPAQTKTAAKTRPR